MIHFVLRSFQAVNCRIGSLEILAVTLVQLLRVNCRIGSLEKAASRLEPL